MFREHARLFTRIQFVTDTLLTCVAFVVAYTTRLHIYAVVPPAIEPLLNPILKPFTAYLWLVGLAVVWWAIVSYSLGLYRISIRRSDWEKIRIVVESSILMGLFLGFVSFAFKLDLSRPLIAMFALYQALFLLLARTAVALQGSHAARGQSSGRRRNFVIVGDGVKARQMGELICRYADWGLAILGYVTFRERRERIEDDFLGTIEDLPKIVENNVVDELIFVGGGVHDWDALQEVLRVCRELGVHTRVALDFFPDKISKVSTEFLENVPVVSFSTAPDHALSLFVKRMLDIVLSAVLLILLLPFMVIVGLLVKATSNGPVVYRQTRCGLYGRKFVLLKFRSMRHGAEDVLWEIKHLNEMDGPVFKMRNDPRVTPLGRILRRSSIDEWPQFWNVLRGDMSLVGPRAPLPEEVREYSGWQRRRLSVKPGITCLWQVSGRNEIDFHEWMKLDLHYIDNWSLLLDLKILLRTVPVVLTGKGAR